MTKQPADLEALFAREIRRAIAVDGRSINAVGLAAGFSRSYLSQLLRGRQDLKVQHVERVLEALDIDPEAFLGQVRTAWLEQRSTPAGSGPSEMEYAQPVDVTTDRGTPDDLRATARTGGEPVGEPADLRAVVRALLRQELPKVLLGELTREVRSHAVSSRESPEASAEATQSDEFENLRRHLGLAEEEFQRELEEARSRVRDLKALKPEKRAAVIDREQSKFRGSLFGALLLEEARNAIPEDPAESLSLAEAALSSCPAAHADAPDPHVRIPGLAVRGNALRALGRLREAEEALAKVVDLLDESGLDDVRLIAELNYYLGSLRKDQYRLREASHHLDRAAFLYSSVKDAEKEAVAHVLLGIVHHRAHEFDAAVESARKALELLAPSAEGRQAAYARYNLALYLHARGDTAEAEAELEEHADLLAGAGETVAAHVTWLRARIAWSRSELAGADRLFREALAWARSRKLHFDAGLISLERALVHLARGRTDRVRKLAKEALALFAREEEVARETRAALEVLEAAARRDALTRKSLEQAVATLDGARHRRPVVESPGQ